MPSVLDSLNTALHRAMTLDPTVYILGEDILDPYGGAFKVCRGLSTSFPDRVLTTPISEAGITGIAAGMALRGLRPVVEIMFGDFTTLIADQLINHAAKFRGMYNDQVRVPLVVRTPMGGRRGYGPTHSQTLEKLYLGAPGLQVIAPCALSLPAKEGELPELAPGSPGDILLKTILDGEDPVLFVENKLLYPLNLQDETSLADFSIQAFYGKDQRNPVFQLGIAGAPKADLTIAAYGYMAELARQAALKLAYEHELFAELIVPTRLSPVDISATLESVRRTGRLITVEEGTLTAGWGAEALARTAAALGPALRFARRVAALEMPIPASRPLEETALPGIPEIMTAALDLPG